MAIELFYSRLLCLMTIVLMPDTVINYIIQDPPQNLCRYPNIYAADRLANGTVRLYKGSYYWELKGLPRPVGSYTGPHHISSMGYRNFMPITKRTTLVTLSDTHRDGTLYRLEGDEYFAWHPNKTQFGGYFGGEYWSEIKNKNGFDTAFVYTFWPQNQRTTLVVAFENDPVEGHIMRYFDPNTHPWTPLSNASDYGGIGYAATPGNGDDRHASAYPLYVDAAFTIQIPDANDKKMFTHFVYMFQEHRYMKCSMRDSDKVKQCDNWASNSELFGCDKVGAGKRRMKG